MKTRIFLIMDTTKKKAGITVLCVVLIATIGTGMAFAASSPKNEKAILTPNNIVNVANEAQAEREIIGPTESKQVINVDVESLDSGEFVCGGGTIYT